MLEAAVRILRTTLFVTLASRQPCMGWCLLQMKQLQRRGGLALNNYYCSALTIRNIGGKAAGTDESVDKSRPRYRLNTTGGLRNLPIIQPTDELLVGPETKIEYLNKTLPLSEFIPPPTVHSAGRGSEKEYENSAGHGGGNILLDTTSPWCVCSREFLLNEPPLSSFTPLDKEF